MHTRSKHLMLALRSRTHRWSVVAFYTVIINFTIGCSNAATPDPVQATFSVIQAQILKPNCTTASCHSTLGQRGGLILDSAVAYNNLINVAPVNDAARAAGLKRVVPSKPDSSFLLIKLTGPRMGEGEQMPYAGVHLDEKSIASIRKWITEGALRN